MFRASLCPSSGATTTVVAASGLPLELGDSSAVGHGRADRKFVSDATETILIQSDAENLH
jgi:hypothetical protein